LKCTAGQRGGAIPEGKQFKFKTLVISFEPHASTSVKVIGEKLIQHEEGGLLLLLFIML
jgi:hypothetical protein